MGPHRFLPPPCICCFILRISLSGFSCRSNTKNAQKFLDANPIIRGINGTELVELVLQYYEKLSDKNQKVIPLKKVYIPVLQEDME